MIVTIDGPAGSGKSTSARMLADRLGFDFLNTGAMYRAVALALSKHGVDRDDPLATSLHLPHINIEMPHEGGVLLNGEEVSSLLYTPDLSAGASIVAAQPAVRMYLAEEQRRLAMGRNIISEGRDQGTFVFPQAECKFFLEASAEVRALRRWYEMRHLHPELTFEGVLAQQRERDARDGSRSVAPMKQAGDAIRIETSELNIAEVVEQMEGIVRVRLAQSTHS